MKKFTTLKEDLIKEDVESKERFDSDLNSLTSRLDEIKSELEELKNETWYTIVFNDVNNQLTEILVNLRNSNPNITRGL